MYLRKMTETVSVLTGDEDKPGWHIVETAAGLEFLQVIGVKGFLRLTSDGRGFPQERAHYVFAIVQLVSEDDGGDKQNGPQTDQG